MKSEPAELTAAEGWQLAIGLLSRREHSSKELLQKLGQKGLSKELALQVLERAQQQQYQSDQRFAELLVRQSLQKGQGMQVLKQHAFEQGLAQDLLQQALDSVAPDWFELALAQYRKKFGEQPAGSDKEKYKRMAFLQRRGFSAEQIRYALTYSEDQE